MRPITVVVAAGARERAVCRRLLGPTPDIAVAGEVGTALEAVAAARRLRPDVLLVGFTRARLDVLAILPWIRRHSARTRILLLTGAGVPEPVVIEALLRGAKGYLGADALAPFLAKAVRALHAGEAWVPRRIVGRLPDRLARARAGTRARARARSSRVSSGSTNALKSSR